MARFLFVIAPATSHVMPTVAIGRVLAERGHEAAWVLHRDFIGLLPSGARAYPFADTMTGADYASFVSRPDVIRSLQQGGLHISLARKMMADTERAIDDFRPTVVVADQLAVAGGMAARRRGIVWATSAPSAHLHRPSVADLKGVEERTIQEFAELQREYSLEPVEWPDRSDELILLYSSAELANPERAFPRNYRFIGPALDGRSIDEDDIEFPWERLDDRPTLLVSFGTIFSHLAGRLLEAVCEALRNEPITVVVATDPALVPDPPSNCIVRPWVPMLSLLSRSDALLCHAGTVANEALLFGKPVLVAPIAYDQPIIANEIVDAGAGLRLHLRRPNPTEIRDSVFSVIRDPAYRESAKRIGDSFRRAGGSRAAVDALEELASRARSAWD